MAKFKLIEDISADKIQQDIDSWSSDVSNNNVEFIHDWSQLTLATPDDSLIFVGPPRLEMAGEDSFQVVGFTNTLQYSETSQVQPMKAIGSSRHVFSRVNSPVQGSIGRMVAHGPNLLRTLYRVCDVTEALQGLVSAEEVSGYAEGNGTDRRANWFSNLDNLLFRVPFGLGVIYRAPSNGLDETYIGADYLEVCSIASRNVSTQSGQGFIMEQVQMMADRIIPMGEYTRDVSLENYTPAQG